MSAFDTPLRMGSMLGFWLALAAIPSVASAQTAQDHRGNRIEPFRQSGIVLDGRDNRGIACTADSSWCAELLRSAPEGQLTLVIAPAAGLVSQSRTYVYVLPPGLVGDGGVSIWGTIVIEADGAVMIGLALSKETRRSGFRSYQRRLVLLRAGTEAAEAVVPVLEVPLSGRVDEAACTSRDAQPTFSIACYNRFEWSALFTLVPQLAPDRPALVMIANAETSPGHRLRSERARAPLESGDNDVTPHSTCSYTRSFFFDVKLGRYVPDAPLPDCSEFLEP